MLYRIAHLEGRERDKWDAMLEGCIGAHDVVCQQARGIPLRKSGQHRHEEIQSSTADKGIGIAHGNTALRDGVNDLSDAYGPILFL